MGKITLKKVNAELTSRYVYLNSQVQHWMNVAKYIDTHPNEQQEYSLEDCLQYCEMFRIRMNEIVILSSIFNETTFHDSLLKLNMRTTLEMAVKNRG